MSGVCQEERTTDVAVPRAKDIGSGVQWVPAEQVLRHKAAACMVPSLLPCLSGNAVYIVRGKRQVGTQAAGGRCNFLRDLLCPNGPHSCLC